MVGVRTAAVEGAGLCATCVHALVRPTNRGTVYLRCGHAAVDPRFPRYPQLPVVRCPAHTERAGDPDVGARDTT